MDAANLRLSATETSLISDAGWILTKNGILQKVNALFAGLADQQVQLLKGRTTPKISRGENYQGLPYLVLDYPRIFEREDVFAIRTFFWWGNFFSTTLHLSGRYQRELAPLIANQYQRAVVNELLIGVFTDPWQYHVEPVNYVPVSGMNEQLFVERVRQHGFLKLSAIVPILPWEHVPEKLMEHYRLLADISSPGGGTGL